MTTETDITRGARRYVFPPHPSGGVILGLTAGQLSAVGATCALTLAIVHGIPGIAGWLAALALAVASYLAIWIRYGGHTTIEWVPVAARYAWTWAATIVGLPGAAARWRSPAVHEVELAAGTGTAGALAPRPVRLEVSLPPELKSVEIVEMPLGRRGELAAAAVHDRAADTWSATIRCEPAAFYLLGEVEQEMRLGGYGGLLVGFAQDDSPVRRIAWYERTLPASSSRLAQYLRDHARPDIPPEDVGLRASRELLAWHEGAAGHHEILVSLQVDARRKAARRAIGNYGGGQAGAVALLAEQTGKLVAELQRISVLTRHADQVAAPTARLLAGIIRNAFDPHSRLEREEFPAGQEPGLPPGSFAPRARDVAWDHVRVDGTLHATGHLLEWPRQDVRATFLEGLLMRTAGEVRTIAMVMEILGPTKAARRAEWAAENTATESWMRHRFGRRTTARDRVRDAATAGAEGELAVGHALVKFAGYVTVSVPAGAGVAALDAAFRRVQGVALATGLRLERMRGEQLDALTFTVPGLCRGLR
jgi:hypothetical protein